MRGIETSLIRPEALIQQVEEGESAWLVEPLPGFQHGLRQRHAGGLATAREQILAEPVDRPRAVAEKALETDERAAAIRHAGQQFAEKRHVRAGS